MFFGREALTCLAFLLRVSPTELAHYEEGVWGVEGHPAEEFWAERHVKVGEGGNRVMEMRGKPTDWFPYGELHPV